MGEKNNTLDSFSGDDFIRFANRVSGDGGACWFLWRDPGFSGFGVVVKEKRHLPESAELDFEFLEDVRIFGEMGEVHLWRSWAHQFEWRFRAYAEPEEADCFDDYPFLWGSRKMDKRDANGWFAYTEDRGITIRLPVEVDPPLRIGFRHFIEKGPDAVAGETDAMIIGLYESDGKAPVPPPLAIEE